jgi:hypothetical protein
MSDVRQFTRDEAIAFGNARAWEAMSFVERARFQMYQELLCMPFDVFHEAISKALGRDVWTPELSEANRQRLTDELNKIVAPPTMDEIIALIPEEKRIIIGDVGDRGTLADRN